MAVQLTVRLTVRVIAPFLATVPVPVPVIADTSVIFVNSVVLDSHWYSYSYLSLEPGQHLYRHHYYQGSGPGSGLYLTL